MINKEKKVAIGVAVGACAVFYALGVVQFDKVLYPNTFINGECYDMDEDQKSGLFTGKDARIMKTRTIVLIVLESVILIFGIVAVVWALNHDVTGISESAVNWSYEKAIKEFMKKLKENK